MVHGVKQGEDIFQPEQVNLVSFIISVEDCLHVPTSNCIVRVSYSEKILMFNVKILVKSK